MASTNRTPRLGLNQWVLDDPFLMEDMNADNAKIDTAVLKEKLFDITLKSPVANLECDFSGIDISEFLMLEVWLSSGDSSCFMRVNGIQWKLILIIYGDRGERNIV